MPSKKLTTDEFIEKAKKVHGDKYDYSEVEYINTSTKVKIICPIHGPFWQSPNKHLNKRGCKQCFLDRKRNSIEDILNRFHQIHGDKYDYSNFVYKALDVHSEIICPKHGSFWQTPCSHFKHGCPKCGKEKQLATMREKYGSDNLFGTDSFRKLSLKKYGTPYPLQSDSIKEKVKKNNIEKYGSEWFMSTAEFKEKARSTINNLYGVDNVFQSEEIKDKIKQSLIEKYGVDHPSKSQEIKNRIKEKNLLNLGVEWPLQSKDVVKKVIDSKKKNKTISSSSLEDALHLLLLQNFSTDDVERHDNSHSRYPFSCDFYIKSRDLFLELNAHWTHGFHWFNPDSEEDQKRLNHLKDNLDSSKFYQSAYQVWTQADQKKKQYAKDNNLNYVVLWNKQDIDDWFALDCPDGHDGDGMYTWKENPQDGCK